MTLDILQGDCLSKTCDLLVVPHVEGSKRLGSTALIVDAAFDGELTKRMEARGFEGRMGERLVIHPMGKGKARAIVMIGVGKKESMKTDTFRLFGGHLVKCAREERARTVVVALPESSQVDTRSVAQAFAEGALLGSHRFHAYKGAQHKKKKEPRDISAITIMANDARSVRLMEEGISLAQTLAAATNLARELVNTPSADMTPSRLAEIATSLAVRGSRISCKVFDEAKMEKMGMHAAIAVGRGSVHRPVTVHLTYASPKAKKRIAIVGKAVTFDSGGLSLKPSEHMTTMKIDMAGAASVIGLFQALATLKPDVEVHGIFIAVENMPSGSAYRPGDVVKAMDGTTIEILNTDAEGRVTLADALTYAKKLEPDAIIDLATLTGACIAALGEDIAGLLANDQRLADRLLHVAEETGEELWQLPLFAPYTKQIASKIADIKNTGGGHGGGAITAALFLKTFVDDISWAHLDIAGPSYVERESRPDQPYGASGYGVRMLTRYLSKV